MIWMRRYASNVSGGQGVAGSNPVAPTSLCPARSRLTAITVWAPATRRWPAKRRARKGRTEKAEEGRSLQGLARAAVLAAGFAAALAGQPATAEETGVAPAAEQSAPISIFDIPTIVEGQRAVAAVLQAGDAAGALALLAALTKRYPDVGVFDYNLAALLAQASRPDEALQSLARAIEADLPAGALEQDAAFDLLRGDPRFQDLVAAAGQKRPPAQAKRNRPPSAEVGDDVAPVSAANTGWDPRFGVLRSLFHFRDEPAAKSSAAARDRSPSRLNAWFRRRDRGRQSRRSLRQPRPRPLDPPAGALSAGCPHPLRRRGQEQPGLTAASTPLPLQRRHRRQRLARRHGRPAVAEPAARCADRPGQHRRLFLQYAANHVYVYPEHRDHDPRLGDLFPANTPYVLISQGSSGSDQPLLDAVIAIFGGISPRGESLSRQQRTDRADGAVDFSHGPKRDRQRRRLPERQGPPDRLRSAKPRVADMIEIAHGLKVEDVPPMVRCASPMKASAKSGREVFFPASGETLFNTPSAIARIIRSTAYDKRLVVNAGANSRPQRPNVDFRWVVLRGDADRIVIRPLNDEGSAAEIVVPWHERVLCRGSRK